MTNSLLKEVDNALKWQRVQQVWHQSYKQILFFVAVFIIALIALLLYKQQQRTQQMKHADALLRFIAAEKTAGSDAIAPSTSDAGTSFQLSQLLLAAESANQGKDSEAHGFLAAAQSAKGASPLLADYSCALRMLSGDSALQTAPCTPTSASHDFSALTLEAQALQQLTAQQPNSAFALLNAEAAKGDAGAMPERLTMLRAYVRSRSSAPTSTLATPSNDALNAPALPAQ